MFNRRSTFNLGLCGAAGSLLLWPTRTRAQTGPVLTPFMDALPVPPSPGRVAPLSDLAPEAARTLRAGYGSPEFYRIVAEVRSVKFHSQLPATEIWGYRDGSLPAGAWDFALGPTLRKVRGIDAFSPTIVRHVNALPALNEHVGFGEPRLSVHLHGAHAAALFDGYPTDFTRADGTPFKVTYEHGEHFDYAYPFRPRGSLDDERDGTTNEAVRTERSTTLWYHDHVLDFTSQNVYRGLAGFFLVYDDLSRIVAQPVRGRGEIWRLINKSGGWWHPVHIHLKFMRVLKRNGKLPFDGTGIDFGQVLERDGVARKDTFSLGPNSEVEVFLKFRDYSGPFVLHCHNMEHEDHAMMARFDVS